MLTACRSIMMAGHETTAKLVRLRRALFERGPHEFFS